MRGVLHRVALVASSLVLALFAGEIGLRVIHPIASQYLLPLPYKRDELRRIAANETYITFDSALGWVPSPGSEHEGGGIVYRANRAGLRAEQEYLPNPSAGVRRLAAFGESFTYCEEADVADCWVAQLEHAWPGTEVLNFGVPGYGPDQAWLRYQQQGRAYHPCAVLIGYMIENINRVVNRFRPFYEPAGGLMLSKPRFLLDGQGLRLLPNPVADPDQLEDPIWVEKTLGPNDQWYFPGTFVANPMDAFQVVRLGRTAAYRRQREDFEFTREWADEVADAYRSQAEAYQVAGRVLVEFARQVRQDGAMPVVVMFGSEIEIRALHDKGQKSYAPLLDWLAWEGIATVDVTENLAQQAGRSGTSKVVENHYRPLGNKTVGLTLSYRLPALTRATCGPP